MLKFFSLLSGSDNPCVAPDSFYNLMQANREHFEKDDDGNGDDDAENDPVRKAFPDKEVCTVLICSSSKNATSCIFPIYKTRVEGSKVVETVHLIKTPENIKKVEMKSEAPDSSLLSSFFVLNEKNEERLNSFGQITSSQISLYDSKMEVKYVIRGLNIRGSI